MSLGMYGLAQPLRYPHSVCVARKDSLNPNIEILRYVAADSHLRYDFACRPSRTSGYKVGLKGVCLEFMLLRNFSRFLIVKKRNERMEIRIVSLCVSSVILIAGFITSSISWLYWRQHKKEPRLPLS